MGSLFNAALLALGIGGMLCAAASRGVRSAARPLDPWHVSTTLLIAGAASNSPR